MSDFQNSFTNGWRKTIWSKSVQLFSRSGMSMLQYYNLVSKIQNCRRFSRKYLKFCRPYIWAIYQWTVKNVLQETEIFIVIAFAQNATLRLADTPRMLTQQRDVLITILRCTLFANPRLWIHWRIGVHRGRGFVRVGSNSRWDLRLWDGIPFSRAPRDNWQCWIFANRPNRYGSHHTPNNLSQNKINLTKKHNL